MEIKLYVSAILVFCIVAAHSYLGERYILIRLFRRNDLPKILGNAEFTMHTLRFAWHLTSIAWLGLASLLILLAHPPFQPRTVVLSHRNYFSPSLCNSACGFQGQTPVVAGIS
jgi:hypothetical protein